MIPQKLPFKWIPKRRAVLYIDHLKNLCEITFWVWGYWSMLHRDRLIVNVDTLLGLLYTIVPSDGEPDDEGSGKFKPSIH